MLDVPFSPELDVAATEAMVAHAQALADRGLDPLDEARHLARLMGAQVTGGGDAVAFGFWVPHLMRFGVAAGDVALEVLRPAGDIDLTVSRRTVRFHRRMLPVRVERDIVWAVVRGLNVGSREQLGDLYQLRYRERDGSWNTSRDVFAASLPFGAFAPAEVYDLEGMHEGRKDTAYFEALARGEGSPESTDAKNKASDDVVRVGPSSNILQLHVGTATLGGTLAGLTRRIHEIAERLRHDMPLRPEDEVFLGYDAIQLLPVEPTTVFEAGPSFFEVDDPSNGEDLPESTTITLRKPHTTNWGYDIVIAGSSAVNPALLESGRPDELVELAAELHTFPTGPIRLIFDVVFGHCDNQALSVINHNYFTGPNMYGQDLNFRHPVVRAILLEMQRRKVDFGADGVRVDGAQDFKYWDAGASELKHDDDYLVEMSEVEQCVAGHRYKPWMIFEDGRPWPKDDWELSSTYRAVIEQQPHTFQWGPLTFAHNTPFLYTFWLNKWWRLQEILRHGDHWISGTANHDTVRRGTQVSPELRINTRLGDTLLEILDNAYDQPAATMLGYAMLPGVPMDFLNASMRVPWGFVRNTDDKYGVKVVAEESTFLDWQVDAVSFGKNWHFRRLKALGFADLEELRRFMLVLRTSVEATDYDLPTMCNIMQVSFKGHPATAGLDTDKLKAICRDYMDDLHVYCNVDYYLEDLNPRQTAFNLALRKLRHDRPWLRGNFDFDAGDTLRHQKPANGTALFFGHRMAPDGSEQLLFVGNMEGAGVDVRLRDLELPGAKEEGWRLLLTSPDLDPVDLDRPFHLDNAEAVLLSRRPPASERRSKTASQGAARSQGERS